MFIYLSLEKCDRWYTACSSLVQPVLERFKRVVNTALRMVRKRYGNL